MNGHSATAQVVVLAGGLGSRLGERGLRVPKILQSVGGEPFIELLLRRFSELGLTSVHLCLGYRSSDVQTYLRASGRRSLEITCSVDSHANEGTAAALRSAGPYLRDRFLVWMGDTYVDHDFTLPVAFHMPVEVPVMVLADRCEDVVPNAAISDGRMVRYRKAGGPEYTLVDTGIAYLDASFLAWPEFRSLAHLEDCWSELAARRKLVGYRTHAAVFDIGTPGRIDVLERRLNRPTREA